MGIKNCVDIYPIETAGLHGGAGKSIIIGVNFSPPVEIDEALQLGVDTQEYLRIEKDGSVFVHGRLVGSDPEIVAALKAFFYGSLAYDKMVGPRG